MWIFKSIVFCCLGLVSTKPTAEIVEEVFDDRYGGVNVGGFGRPQFFPCQAHCSESGAYPVPVPSKPVIIHVPVPSPPEKIYVPGPSIPVPIPVEKRIPYPVPINRPYPVQMPPVSVPYPVNHIIPVPGKDRLVPVLVPVSDTKYYPVSVIIYVSPICRHRQPLLPFWLPGTKCMSICKVKYNYVYLESQCSSTSTTTWGGTDYYPTGPTTVIGGWPSTEVIGSVNTGLGGFTSTWSNPDTKVQTTQTTTSAQGGGGFGTWSTSDTAPASLGGFGGAIGGAIGGITTGMGISGGGVSAIGGSLGGSSGGLGGFGVGMGQGGIGWSGTDGGFGGWSGDFGQGGMRGFTSWSNPGLVGMGSYGGWSNTDVQGNGFGIGVHRDTWPNGVFQAHANKGTIIRTRSGDDSEKRKKRSANLFSAMKSDQPSENAEKH